MREKGGMSGGDLREGSDNLDSYLWVRFRGLMV